MLLLLDIIFVLVLSYMNWMDVFVNIDVVYGQIYNGVFVIVGFMILFIIKVIQLLCVGFYIFQIVFYVIDLFFDFFLDFYSYFVWMSLSDIVENCVFVDFVFYFNWIWIVVLVFRDDYGLNGLVVFKDIVLYKGWILVVVESF